MTTRIARLTTGLLVMAACAAAQVSNLGFSSYGDPMVYGATWQDYNGYSDISQGEILFSNGGGYIGGGNISTVEACYIIWSGGDIYLANDAASGWLGPLSTTVQNSQCKLYAAGSSAMGINDYALTLKVKVGFFSSFSARILRA